MEPNLRGRVALRGLTQLPRIEASGYKSPSFT
jgi:hypothetical protein